MRGIHMIPNRTYAGHTMSENSHDTTAHSGKRTDCHLCLKPNAKMKHLHQLQSQFKETYAWLKEHKAELDNAACLVAGRNSPPGTMGEMSMDADSDAKFSFLRLIGCAYVSAFRSQTPEALFNSVSNATTTYDNHAKWLAIIRTTVRQRVDMESKAMPSTEALLLHWRRCIWVVGMWHCLPGVLHLHTHTHAHAHAHAHARTQKPHTHNTLWNYVLAALTDYGWKRQNGKLQIEWEVPQNIAKSKSSIDFFLSGCKCKTGCSTRICSCKKKERKCGPSCSCHFCKNTSERNKRDMCK